MGQNETGVDNAAEVEDAVGKEIIRVRPKEVEERQVELCVGRTEQPPALCVSTHKRPEGRRAECYLEARHADLPGEIAAICGAIKKLGINIDELQLHATDPGLDRERIVRLWVSHLSTEEGSCPSESVRAIDRILLLQLEASLLRLVGVRSVEVRHLTRGV